MIAKMMQQKGSKYIWRMAYVLIGMLAVVSIVQGVRNAVLYSQDFQWDAAKALAMRINPYLESLNPGGLMASFGYEEYFKQMEANQFPSLLFLLLPYTFLEPMTARYAWLISNLIFTGVLILLLRKTFFREADAKTYGLLVILMIAGTPWRNQIGVGQHTLFSFMFFLLAVWLSEKGRTVPASLSLAVSFFKYTLTVPLSLYFIYKKKWKELFISVTIHVAATAFSAFWLKESFLNMIIQPLKVSSALVGEGSMDLSAVMGGSPIALLLGAMVMLVLAAGAFFMPEGNDELVITILTMWSLIIAYHRTYDYFVLIVPACYFLKERRRLEQAGFAALLLAVFFFLRVFHEALPAMIVVGIGYYWYTFVLMGMGMRTIKGKWKEKRNG